MVLGSILADFIALSSIFLDRGLNFWPLWFLADSFSPELNSKIMFQIKTATYAFIDRVLARAREPSVSSPGPRDALRKPKSLT